MKGLSLGLSLTGGSSAAEETPDANTLFLTRFRDATPKDEVDNSSGTLVGNASCDTANRELVLDGAGDWVTFAGGTKFDPTSNWTLEFHCNVSAAEVGGIVSRGSTGASRYAVYINGAGNAALYDQSGVLASMNGLDGSWHHFAFVIEGGSTFRAYFDGVQTSAGTNIVPASATDDFYIGTDVQNPTARDIACRIARVKLSNVARYPSGTSFTPPSRTAV